MNDEQKLHIGRIDGMIARLAALRDDALAANDNMEARRFQLNIDALLNEQAEYMHIPPKMYEVCPVCNGACATLEHKECRACFSTGHKPRNTHENR